jgi:hypothetical protein
VLAEQCKQKGLDSIPAASFAKLCEKKPDAAIALLVKNHQQRLEHEQVSVAIKAHGFELMCPCTIILYEVQQSPASEIY